MADRFSNSDGTLGPDKIDDSLAPPNIRAAGEANLKKAESDARLAVMGGGTGVIPQGSLTTDSAALAAEAQRLQAMYGNQNKDDSFKVRVTNNNREYTIPQFISSTGTEVSKTQGIVGVDTLLKDGFLGLNDQSIIDQVVSVAGGKTEAYDTIYKAAVSEAAYKQKAGKPDTVEDILARWGKGGLPENLRKLVSGGGGSGGAFSTTNRVISLTDQGTARQLINRALSSYLGRQATDMENKMFLKALNVQERENPSITRTKGYSDGSGNTTQSQTVTGGFNREDFAERFAKSQEGYAEYQAATTYLDAFIGALESDSRVI